MPMPEFNLTLHHSGVKHLCMAVKRTISFILSPCQDRDYKNRHTGNRLSLSGGASQENTKTIRQISNAEM